MKFQLALGHGKTQPPEHLRDRILKSMDPLPIWYSPFEETLIDKDEFTACINTEANAMYHSWERKMLGCVKSTALIRYIFLQN